jgi:hypothetical protein
MFYHLSECLQVGGMHTSNAFNIYGLLFRDSHYLVKKFRSAMVKR